MNMPQQQNSVPTFPNVQVEIIRYMKDKTAVSKAYGKPSHNGRAYTITTHDGQDLAFDVFLFAREKGVQFPNFKVELVKTNKDGSKVVVGQGWRTAKGNGYKLKITSDKNMFGQLDLFLTDHAGKNFSKGNGNQGYASYADTVANPEADNGNGQYQAA